MTRERERKNTELVSWAELGFVEMLSLGEVGKYEKKGQVKGRWVCDCQNEFNDTYKLLTATTQELVFFFYSYQQYTTHTHIYTQQRLGGTETPSSFLQGEAFRQFHPLSLNIFLEHQASLPRPPLQSSTLLREEEKFFGVLTRQKLFCHLSVE